MPPKMSFSKKPKDARGTLRRMLAYVGEFRLLILLVLVMSAVSNVLSLLGPSLAGSAISAAAAGKGQVDMRLVTHYAGLMLACYLASSLITIAIQVVMMSVSKWIARKMRKDVFDKLMRLPVGFFDRNLAGDIISRVSYDVDVVSTCVATDLVQILTSVITVVGSFVMMIVISPPLSVVVVVTIPVSVAYTAFMRKKTRPLYTKRSKEYGVMNGFVEEMFSGQRTIQAYAHEDTVNDRFEKVDRAAAEAYGNADRWGVTMGPTMGSINNMSLGLIAMLGSVLYMYGAATLGQISSFVLYSRKFSGPINEIANIIN